MAALSVPQFQTAIIQSGDAAGTGSTNLTISHAVPTPVLTSSHDVLVRVLAVALNPTDHKMPAHFPSPGNRVGCDFCGVVVQTGHQNPATPLPQFTPLKPGTRVCGGLFPYGRQTGDHATCGAFAQFVVADSRLLIRVPDAWSDLEAAALGGIGWTTAGLALSGPDALNLPGLPSRPAGPAPEEGGPVPVLVYGAAAATGTMACQLLALSGYAPVAVASGPSAALVAAYGARAAAAYTSPTRARDGLPAAWRTRRAVRVREVMAFEGHGRDVVVDDPTYSRAANPALFGLCRRWTAEVQRLVDAGRLRSHPVREVPGAWQGVIDGLATLRKGLVRGEKLAVQISDLG